MERWSWSALEHLEQRGRDDGVVRAQGRVNP